MRVIILSFEFLEYTIQLANALSEIEDVILMLPINPTEKFLDLIDEKVNVSLFKKPRLRYPFANLKMVHNILKNLKIVKPDVLHIQAVHMWLSVFGLPFVHVPIIATIHDPTPHLGEEKYRTSIANKFTIRHTNSFIVHGKKMKGEMVSAHGILPSKVYNVHLGNYSILLKWKKEDIHEENNTILFFGRIWPYKGLDYLIKAEPFITKAVADAKIIIAGRGEDFTKYKQMMVNKNHFIVYNEYISNEMVTTLFQKASIVVLPYVEATQSAVVPIAYAFKKPVVVTDVGSIPEVVDDGKTGFVVPPKNIEKLAEAIIKILKNDELRKKMGENAYMKAKEELSWDKIAEKTIKVYEKTIESRRNK